MLRKATIDDIPTLLMINLASFKANQTYDKYIDMNWIHTDDAKKHFTDAVTKNDHYSIIAEADGVPVGYIVLASKIISYRIAKVIELDNLSVLPAHRSRGIGKKLVEEAKRWAKSQGYMTIYVNAYYKNQKGIDFYKKQGFAPIDISLEYELV